MQVLCNPSFLKIYVTAWISILPEQCTERFSSHIRCLRQKLRALGAPENFIETVHGLGYRLKQK